MSKGQELAVVLLEGDEEQKANDIIAKWDRAHASYLELAAKKREARRVFNELGASIGLNRELARLGLKWEDQLHFIRGDQVGATDNYKREMPAKICHNQWCGLRMKYQPVDMIECPECKEALTGTLKRTTPSDLRTKLAGFYVGAELKDGRKVWFKDPVPPKHHEY